MATKSHTYKIELSFISNQSKADLNAIDNWIVNQLATNNLGDTLKTITLERTNTGRKIILDVDSGKKEFQN